MLEKHDLNYDGTRAIDGGAAEFRKRVLRFWWKVKL